MKKLLILSLWGVFAQAQAYFMVFFEPDQYVLNNIQTDRLTTWVKNHSKDKVIAIEGYTDADGSVGYNDTLAKKRVDFVLSLIKNNMSIRDDFRTRSYGKLHEQFQEKSKNRRVTITYIPEKDLAREQEILNLVTTSNTALKPKISFPYIFAIQDMRGQEILLEIDQVFMQELYEAKPGTKLIVKGLNFHFNTFAITNDSRPKLYELLLVMQKNPNLKIDIRGHMCCNPSQQPDKLSGDRAKAVKIFLMRHGIENQRVTFKGMGSTDPMFEIPEENEEQRAANRRVEIFIVDNK